MRGREREAREDMEMHGCEADGCVARVPMSSLGCRHHWMALSDSDRLVYLRARSRRNESRELEEEFQGIRLAAIQKMTIVGGLRNGAGAGKQGPRPRPRGAKGRGPAGSASLGGGA